jgi:hypothetical protein
MKLLYATRSVHRISRKFRLIEISPQSPAASA